MAGLDSGEVEPDLQYEAESDNGSQIFVNILLRAVNTGLVTAFQDDRFSIPMQISEVTQLTVGSADTVCQNGY